ncbi:hypothetical protein KIW84_013999 [Lathyrus oleraceus]|uniref:Uncharacterized protein n=1 Tax=Pisum sativum TaxID=3888 RepID=A0A9D5BLP5_PEA|nr:hypothetical protein KIW84_013998 [Pisum sativum]KAI5445989.1 hypothetical protein KIW84_013999 [Pisum sativum]
MNSDSFSALPGSIHLDLSSNQLNGSISKFISEMQSIKYLNLANNTLHGVVPFNLTFVKGFGSIQTWLNRSAGFCSRNGHPETISAQPLVASGSEESLEKKLKDGPKRCSNCNKRFDKHGCPFDYHTAGRDAIAKANLVAIATSPSVSSSETPTTAITVSSSPSRINSKLKPHPL